MEGSCLEADKKKQNDPGVDAPRSFFCLEAVKATFLTGLTRQQVGFSSHIEALRIVGRVGPGGVVLKPVCSQKSHISRDSPPGPYRDPFELGTVSLITGVSIRVWRQLSIVGSIL